MEINGQVIMWVFGLVFVSFGSLVSIVWSMLIHRIKTTETQFTAFQKNQRETTNKIFNEIKSLGENFHEFSLDVAKNMNWDGDK